MKKFITALFLLTALCAGAEMPERARELTSTQRIVCFYNEMDRFDAEFPDAIADIEYSCNRAGDIFFGRRMTGRIDFPPLYTGQQLRPALKRIENVTDSVYRIRKDGEYVSYKATGSYSMVTDKHSNHSAAYRFWPKEINKRSSDFEIADAVTEFHPGESYSDAGGFIINDDENAYSIMQEIFISTGRQAKPADMSAIKKFCSKMPRPKNGRSEKRTGSSKDWHQIYALFLDRLWTGEAITLNYSRALRTITLTDLTTGTTYTATYRNNILSLTII